MRDAWRWSEQKNPHPEMPDGDFVAWEVIRVWARASSRPFGDRPFSGLFSDPWQRAFRRVRFCRPGQVVPSPELPVGERLAAAV